MCIHTCVYIYIYIYREREREIEREGCIHILDYVIQVPGLGQGLQRAGAHPARSREDAARPILPQFDIDWRLCWVVFTGSEGKQLPILQHWLKGYLPLPRWLRSPTLSACARGDGAAYDGTGLLAHTITTTCLVVMRSICT